MTKQNVLVIINPVAGRKKAKSMLFEIIDTLCRSNCKPIIFTTTKKGEATDIVVAHAREADKIICCGGDGTMNEVLTGLIKANSAIPVGYIPTGTTNDLATSLKLSAKASSVADMISGENIRQHDLGLFNENQLFLTSHPSELLRKYHTSHHNGLKICLGGQRISLRVFKA